jgi:Skp family chaperone for outer membrane proteins
MRRGVVLLAAGLALPVAAQEAPGPAASAAAETVADGPAAGGPAAPSVPVVPPDLALSGAAVQGPAMVPVVVIDPDRLFRESAFGRASAARVSAEQAALVAENRRLEAELEAEERDLTARRATLPPEEFRALATAFDAKAEGIRKAQAEKDRAITESRQADQQRFLQVAAPELARMMSDMGAVAMLDKQVVFLSFDSIDVTDRAIVRINAALGDGAAPAAP